MGARRQAPHRRRRPTELHRNRLQGNRFRRLRRRHWTNCLRFQSFPRRPTRPMHLAPKGCPLRILPSRLLQSWTPPSPRPSSSPWAERQLPLRKKQRHPTNHRSRNPCPQPKHRTPIHCPRSRCHSMFGRSPVPQANPIRWSTPSLQMRRHRRRRGPIPPQARPYPGYEIGALRDSPRTPTSRQGLK